MICDAGAVCIVPFPFTERPIQKRRPALVLSSIEFNRDHGQSVMAMITTARRARWPSDHALLDYHAAGLQMPCMVRFKVFTLMNDDILRLLGRLSGADGNEVNARIGRIIGISPTSAAL